MAETARPQLMPQVFWETHLVLADWPEQAERGPRVAKLIRAFAEDLEDGVASGVALSAKSETGLVESPLNFFDCVDDEDSTALISWIDACIRQTVIGVNRSQLSPDALEVEFCDSWFHITNRGGFHDAHTHGNCSWCGIFYVVAGNSAPAKGGAAGNGINRFYGPLGTGGVVRDFGNAYLGNYYVDVEPKDGRLVLFPSYLLHSALPYSGDQDRIVLAFNTRTTKT